MEAWKEGKLTAEDTGGLELNYGDAEMMVRLTEMIGKREGFGDLLAEGSAMAAKKIGRGTEDYLITSKGQEAPAHMPPGQAKFEHHLRCESVRRRPYVQRTRPELQILSGAHVLHRLGQSAAQTGIE